MLAEPRRYADPDVAAHELVGIANGFGPVRDGRIFIELINAPFLLIASPKEHGAGPKRAVEKGWLFLHESRTFVRFTQPGADLFA